MTPGVFGGMIPAVQRPCSRMAAANDKSVLILVTLGCLGGTLLAAALWRRADPPVVNVQLPNTSPPSPDLIPAVLEGVAEPLAASIREAHWSGPSVAGPSEATRDGGIQYVTIGEDRREFRVEWQGNVRRLLYEDGRPYCEGVWIDGKPEGEHQGWHENGQILSKTTYAAGKRTGPCAHFDKNGRRISEGSYRGGYRDGPWLTWYPNGHLRSVGTYKASPEKRRQVQVGHWTYWSSEGLVDDSKSGMYEDGKKVGP